MSAATSAQNPVENLQRSAIRRSFAFIFVPAVFLFFITALSESDQWTHALDDEIIVVTLLAALVYLLITRKLSTVSDLVRINRVGLVATAIVVIAGVLAVVLEFSDAADISDDPITIVAGALAVINALLLLTATGPRAPEEAARYGTEWSRMRTTFFFSALFLVTFVTYVIPPYPAFSLSALATWGEVAVLLLAGVVGIVLLARSRRESNPATLRTYNNIMLVLAIIVSVFAFTQFDLGTLPFSAALIANRFL